MRFVQAPGCRHGGLCTGRFTRTALPLAAAVPDEVQLEGMGASPWPPQFRNRNPPATLSQCLSPLGFPALFFARKKKCPLWGKDLGKLIFFFFPFLLFRESRKAEQEAGQAGKGKMTMLSRAVKSVLVQLFFFFFYLPPPFPLPPEEAKG